mmetsp:Transcript_27895/g.82707  ORF Transcript_27895/g.82707 Transcript_27895/m.82707 type:complete len:361 (-) Transcript_27895:408-1490(-)
MLSSCPAVIHKMQVELMPSIACILHGLLPPSLQAGFMIRSSPALPTCCMACCLLALASRMHGVQLKILPITAWCAAALVKRMYLPKFSREVCTPLAALDESSQELAHLFRHHTWTLSTQGSCHQAERPSIWLSAAWEHFVVAKYVCLLLVIVLITCAKTSHGSLRPCHGVCGGPHSRGFTPSVRVSQMHNMAPLQPQASALDPRHTQLKHHNQEYLTAEVAAWMHVCSCEICGCTIGVPWMVRAGLWGVEAWTQKPPSTHTRADGTQRLAPREAQQQRQHSKTFAISRERRKGEGGLERRCARCQCLKWGPSPLDGQKRTPGWATPVHHGQASLGRQLPAIEAHGSGPANHQSSSSLRSA